MCESIDWQRQLPGLSFGVAAVAEKCTSPGSYERILIDSVYRLLRSDLEKAAAQWAAERERKGKE